MFLEGSWVVDSSEEYGYIAEIKSTNTFSVVFPHNGKIATRFATELKPAPIETTYNDYNIHALQNLAVNTKDKVFFDELSNRLGVE